MMCWVDAFAVRRRFPDARPSALKIIVSMHTALWNYLYLTTRPSGPTTVTMNGIPVLTLLGNCTEILELSQSPVQMAEQLGRYAKVIVTLIPVTRQARLSSFRPISQTAVVTSRPGSSLYLPCAKRRLAERQFATAAASN